MNRHSIHTRGHALLAAIAGLSIALAAHAQPTNSRPEAGATQPPATNLRTDSTGEVHQFDLTFPGGTVSEYFDAIRAIPGVVANISLSPDARSVPLPMPPIRLTNVSVAVAVRAVETIADETGAPIFLTRTIEADNSSTLYAITARPTRAAKPEAELLHSFRVGSLLNPSQGGVMVADTLLGAIETLLSMDTSGRTPARVMLHKETSTLIMQGRTSELQAVETLIEGLERDAQQRRELMKPNQSLIANLKAEQQAIGEKREILHERMRLCEKQSVEIRHMIEKGLAPQSELEKVRERARELEEQRIELELRESHISSRLSEALAASGVQESETFRIHPDRAEATLEAAVAIATTMSPPVLVARGDEPGQMTFRASPDQLLAIRKWLHAQSLLVD